jgi:hypothetical protein
MEAKDTIELKGNMYRFITEHQSRFVPETYIEEILSVKIKEDDDDHGPMGKHYVVKLKQRMPDFSFTSGNQYKSVESTCLVNARQFNHFVGKLKAVIWL